METETDKCQEDTAEQAKEDVPKQELTSSEIEKNEEAKLKAKFPQAVGGGLGGHSAFLQKKLAKGQKYFDSGDYQMARQNIPTSKKQALQSNIFSFGTGETIPTPESVPVRKTSIIQPKFHPSISPPNSTP
ncbi:cAMP-regulated phosphoprotein 19 [Cimex lectularius]|uniref:Alpha-endosulfine n=1 Tax=Cimex lectularius TaxID=79782 RepID=A0A8I6RTA3_CIMLE|nr:cAMP-regulated phosphoprotein 19 [Cimex lectularius]XP_024081026.1 cAMP-regulated phosphoprotein 19 [Cimex lectularius]